MILTEDGFGDDLALADLALQNTLGLVDSLVELGGVEDLFTYRTRSQILAIFERQYTKTLLSKI